MSVFSAISRFAADYSAARSRYHTERMLGALPLEIQKDIGWPLTEDPREIKRASFTFRAGRK